VSTLDVARGDSQGLVTGAGMTRDIGPHGIPGIPEMCRRFDYHDGPCNGYPRKQCLLKTKLEREGKILMNETDNHADHLAEKEAGEKQLMLDGIRRGWISAAWAWITGQL
jgi:hypothetical protein